MQFKTHVVKGSDIKRDWVVIDATGIRLGRLATYVAHLLKGKHKPIYSPHLDCGDHVIIVNAARVDYHPDRLTDKKYYRHSGYPGGLKVETLGQVLSKKPERVIERAVKGMLPKGPLGRDMYRKLHVYAGETHPHQAQQPKEVKLA